jgi:hypothetical protein
VKFVWELNRHHELLRLAQAFALTGHAAYAEKSIGLLGTWWDANPRGMGVNWVSVLDVSFRAITWAWIRRLTAESAAWTPERVARLQLAVEQSARFIDAFDSVHHSPNTHLTGEALGLLVLGSAFPELPQASAWRDHGVAILQSEVTHQFLADGMHYERATGYHRYNIEFYLLASTIARASGEDWDRPWQDSLRRGLDALAALKRADGLWPVIGDEDGGSTLRLWGGAVQQHDQLLALGAAVFGNADWRRGLSEGSSSLAWWLGYKVDDPLPLPESGFEVLDLPAAGYFGARSSRAWSVLVDAGPHGGDRTGHAHTDLGHVEIANAEGPVIVDPGCAVYTADLPRRDWYRSLGAHATLCIGGDRLAEPSHAFGWKSIAPQPEVSVSTEEWGWSARMHYALPSDHGITHERQVALIHGAGVLVIDFVTGIATTSLRWNWPFGTSVSDIEKLGEGAVARGEHFVLSFVASVPVQSMLSPSRCSPTYGSERASVALDVRNDIVQLPVSSIAAFSFPGQAPVGLFCPDPATASASFPDSGGLGTVRVDATRRGPLRVTHVSSTSLI